MVIIAVKVIFVSRVARIKNKSGIYHVIKRGINRKILFEKNENLVKFIYTLQRYRNICEFRFYAYCLMDNTGVEEVRGHEYILTHGRYVGTEEVEDDGEPFDEKMTRLTGELAEMFAKSHGFEDEIRQRLGAIGYEL